MQEWRRGNRELREGPAIGKLVVENDRIAVVIGLAASAEAQPECVAIGRSGDERSGRLVEHRKRSIDPLHVLRRADRAVGIGGSAGHGESKLTLSQAFKPVIHSGRGGIESVLLHRMTCY